MSKNVVDLPQKELLSVKDLCNSGLDFSATTYLRWRQKGSGPAFVRFSHNIIRYPRSGVLAWLASLETTGLETRDLGHEKN